MKRDGLLIESISYSNNQNAITAQQSSESSHLSPSKRVATQISSPLTLQSIPSEISNEQQKPNGKQQAIPQNNKWKEDLGFLSDFGYNLDTITPTTRIRVIHENSLNSIGGRSAPYACNLMKYLSHHPECRVAYKYEEEKHLPQKFWCKHCGCVIGTISPHQVTCLYHGSNIDSSTCPNDVYGFIDGISEPMDMFDDNDMNMSEWLSIFGGPNDILHSSHTIEETHPLIVTIDEENEYDQDIKLIVDYWLSIASDNTLSVNTDALAIIQDCLDLFYANIIEETNEESKKRVTSGNRTLVPSLVGGILLSNKYLRFLSNSGLRKPEPVL